MSAVSNITWVWVQDKTNVSPEKDTTPFSFSNYNEAMSYAKWISLNEYGEDVRVNVWNYNGGSGYWEQGVFVPRGNTNWP